MIRHRKVLLSVGLSPPLAWAYGLPLFDVHILPVLKVLGWVSGNTNLTQLHSLRQLILSEALVPQHVYKWPLSSLFSWALDVFFLFFSFFLFQLLWTEKKLSQQKKQMKLKMMETEGRWVERESLRHLALVSGERKATPGSSSGKKVFYLVLVMPSCSTSLDCLSSRS